MTREQYVRDLIRRHGLSVKGFAQSISMPYTTLLSMLKNGLGGASIDNVIRVCRGLGITVEDLQNVLCSNTPQTAFHLSPQEKRLVNHYRDHPDMQRAVDILLGMHDKA